MVELKLILLRLIDVAGKLRYVLCACRPCLFLDSFLRESTQAMMSIPINQTQNESSLNGRDLVDI